MKLWQKKWHNHVMAKLVLNSNGLFQNYHRIHGGYIVESSGMLG